MHFEDLTLSRKISSPENLPQEKDFSFAAPDVLKTLSTGKKIEYIGSATSDFQAEPLLFDASGKPQVFSDWEFELAKNREGRHSGIPHATTEEMPKFRPHMQEYISRSKELGENMFRFSLDFARLCPEKGEFNEGLMAEYVQALARIRAHGQEPMLAVYHWPMPKYLTQYDREGNVSAGGWEHPDIAEHFKYYVNRVIGYLANEDKVRAVLKNEHFTKEAQDQFLSEGLVKYFLTLNEPSQVLIDGYVAGIFPPFKKGKFFQMKHILEKLIEAHDIAQNEIKTGNLPAGEGGPQVGLSHNWTYFDGVLGNLLQEKVNEKITKKFERGGGYTDFLALQYYCRVTVPSLYPPLGPLRPKDRAYGDHPGHGDIYPRGVYEHLKSMNKLYPQKEIFLSEFGFSDKHDLRRPYWILETVRYVLEAKRQGVPIKGMLLWSLVNNFEWERGMEQKFGLFDEKDLAKPLEHSSGEDEVRGWEAWQAVTRAIADPSAESLQNLQTYYEKAKKQFEKATNVNNI